MPALLCVFATLLIFIGLTPYLGLRTAGSFSMFSNLRTEGDSSNHLLLGSNPIKVWGYQEDVVWILEIDDRYGDTIYHYDGSPRGYALPVVEFRKWIYAWGQAGYRVPMTYAYDGYRHTTEDIVTDPAWRTADLQPGDVCCWTSAISSQGNPITAGGEHPLGVAHDYHRGVRELSDGRGDRAQQQTGEATAATAADDDQLCGLRHPRPASARDDPAPAGAGPARRGTAPAIREAVRPAPPRPLPRTPANPGRTSEPLRYRSRRHGHQIHAAQCRFLEGEPGGGLRGRRTVHPEHHRRRRVGDVVLVDHGDRAVRVVQQPGGDRSQRKSLWPPVPRLPTTSISAERDASARVPHHRGRSRLWYATSTELGSSKCRNRRPASASSSTLTDESSCRSAILDSTAVEDQVAISGAMTWSNVTCTLQAPALSGGPGHCGIRTG